MATEVDRRRVVELADRQFQDVDGTPLTTKNFLRRHIWPAAIRAGIIAPKPKEWPKGKVWVDPNTSVNFKAFRRTCATWFQKVGTAKDIQAQLRHSTPTTTLGVYVQELPERVKSNESRFDRTLPFCRVPPYLQVNGKTILNTISD